MNEPKLVGSAEALNLGVRMRAMNGLVRSKPTTRRYSIRRERSKRSGWCGSFGRSSAPYGTVYRVAKQLGYGDRVGPELGASGDIDDGITGPGTRPPKRSGSRRSSKRSASCGARTRSARRRLSSRRSSTAHRSDRRVTSTTIVTSSESSPSAARCRWLRARTTRRRAGRPRRGRCGTR